MNLDQSVRLQRRISLFATMGLLVTGLSVAVATAFPLYRHAQEVVGVSLQDNARNQARTVGQFLGKAVDIAGQIASRTAIRDKLEGYNAWDISLAELAAFSTPRLRDALDQAGNVAGMVRFDRDDYPVLALGEPIPMEQVRLPAPGQTGPVVTGPSAIGNVAVLVVSVPIIARGSDRVGTDVVAFDLAPLQRMLTEADRQDEPLRRLLLNHDGGSLFEIARQDRVRSAQELEAESEILVRALAGPTGMARVTGPDGASWVVAYDAIAELPGWSFALVLPASAFDAPVLNRMVTPLLTIIALVLAGALLTARAIRPVADRVLEQSRRLAKLTDGMTLAASVFEGSPQAVVILDRDHRILECNHACVTLTGFGPADLRGRRLCDALCEPEHHGFCKRVWDAVERDGEWQGETRVMRSGGGTFPAWHSISPVRGSDGVVRHYIAMFSDITDKKLAEDQIRHLAHHDVLTDLPNRSLFSDRLGHALERARRGRLQLALMFIDLDRFKNVNDSLGHQAGDQLLRAVARRLQGLVREEDTLARFGGDEFVMMIENVRDPDGAARVALKVLSALEAPIGIDGHEIYVGASVGIALYPHDGDDSEALLRSADSAMYEAKGAGRSTYRFYTAEQTRISRERFELEGGLRRALERGELRLVYQPQADCVSGRLIGVEALVRWQHPERGLVAPDQFIPLAEEIGLIGQIGAWVLDTACAQARAWELAGRPLRMAVNLSGQQVSRDDLYAVVSDTLMRTGLSPQWLELEITEGHILKRVEVCIASLQRVKSLGVTLAIDDFGTGYSSLSYLKRLPLDRLKIDRSFVEGIPGDADDVAIVATILSMARNLGLEVIAEGVETPEQLEYLITQRCGQYQGYHLGRPMPAVELDAWVATYEDEVVAG